MPRRNSRNEANARALATDHLVGDLGRRTARGGMIAILAQIAKAGLMLATLAILARLLEPGDFGLIAMAMTVTAFVGMFTDLGLSTATVQRENITQDTVSALFFLNLILGAVVMAAVIALAPVAAWFFDDPRVEGVVTALALPIPLLAASRQHAALLQRGMRWIAIQWTALAAEFAAAVVAVALAWGTELGYWALVAQAWVSAALTLILLWTACPWRPSRPRDFSQLRSAVGFGAHLTGFQFLNYFHRQFDDALVGWRWGAPSLGYYTRAYELLMVPIGLINAPVGSVVVPALSRIQDQPCRWRNAYLDALGAVALVNAGITAILVASAEPLVRLAFGPQWDNAATIFLYLSISMFASAPMNTVGWIYLSLGDTRRMALWGLVATPIIIVSFVLGLPFGPAGVALSYSVAVCALLVPCFMWAAKGKPVSARDLLRASLGPILLGAASAFLGRAASTESTHSLIVAVAQPALVAAVLYGIGATALVFLDPNFSRVRKSALSGYVLRRKNRDFEAKK